MEHSSRRRENIEQDILTFQKQLQNLPDFDSPDNPNNNVMDAALALNEFLYGRSLLRPRSRSMPRVAYESNRYLALPDVGITSRLRGRSAGTLGFPTELHSGAVGPLLINSPATTPTDDRRPSYNPPVTMTSSTIVPQGISSCTSNSRRSSLSPASDRTNRRRDSPALMQMEIPPWHRSILSFIEVS